MHIYLNVYMHPCIFKKHAFVLMCLILMQNIHVYSSILWYFILQKKSGCHLQYFFSIIWAILYI